MSLTFDLSFARRIASEAGGILKSGAFQSHVADRKRVETDLVTEYDRRSEKLIVEAIREQFPGDLILAEEGGQTGAPASGRRWLIDPLDGTTNFAHGLPFFCVSIALEVEGEPIIGVVQAPALGWSFWAARGEGAWWNGRRLAVSGTPTLGEALLATGFPYDRKTSPENNFDQFVAMKKQAQGVRRLGAAALDLAMVGAGWLDGYWEMKLKPWDLAAGALIVTEAGGRVSAWSGGAFVVDSGEAVATNGRIHDALVAALRAV
ncbi:MAG TPA: inositol monophosphatase family protein [Kofleriaceae bacterium]|nr:inositol monophosphatase family protein [Kofleriaceae bacterium]